MWTKLLSKLMPKKQGQSYVLATAEYQTVVAYMKQLTEQAKNHCVSVYMNPKTGKYRRELIIDGKIVAWECRMSKAMAEIPWQDRAVGGYIYVDKQVWEKRHG